MGASFPASLATSFLAPAISFVVTCKRAVAVSCFDTAVQPLQFLSYVILELQLFYKLCRNLLSAGSNTDN